MTYDERREIDEYLSIVKKNCERTLRSIELMQGSIKDMNIMFGGRSDGEDEKE